MLTFLIDAVLNTVLAFIKARATVVKLPVRYDRRGDPADEREAGAWDGDRDSRQ